MHITNAMPCAGVIGGVVGLILFLILVGLFAGKGVSWVRKRNLHADGAGGLPQTAPRGGASAASAAPAQVPAQRSFGVLGAGIQNAKQKAAAPASTAAAAPVANPFIPSQGTSTAGGLVNGLAASDRLPNGLPIGHSDAVPEGAQKGMALERGARPIDDDDIMSSKGSLHNQDRDGGLAASRKGGKRKAAAAHSGNQAAAGTGRKGPAKKPSRAAGLFAKLTGKRAAPERAIEPDQQFRVNPRNPLAVPQPTVVPAQEPESPLAPTAITISDAEAPSASAAGSSSQNASNGSGPADCMYVNPLTEESFSSGSNGLVAANLSFTAGPAADPQVQAKRLRRNEGPLAAPSSPVTPEGSFHFGNAASGLSQDVDLDALLLSEAGSPHPPSYPPHLKPATAANPFEVGTPLPNPLVAGAQAAAAAGTAAGPAAVLQDPRWDMVDMDSSSMDLSSLHNDWFDTFSDGSHIKHLQTDQVSVDGDRSEDGSMPVMTTHSSIEPPSPSGAGKGYRRPGTLLEIAARDQARSTKSFIKRHETMMKDALASIKQPAPAAGSETAGAAPTFAQGQAEGLQQAASGTPISRASKGKKKATALKGVADLRDTANGDWECLMMHKEPTSAVPHPRAHKPSSTHLLQQDPAAAHLALGASGNPFSSYRPSPYAASAGPQKSVVEAMYGDDDDLTLDNPLLYDGPILDKCDTETILSGSSVPRPMVGGATRNPTPPSGDLFWKTFQAMEEEGRGGVHWPERNDLETSGTMTSMFGTHNLSLTSTFPSDGQSSDMFGPMDMGPFEAEPSKAVHSLRRGRIGDDEGTLLDRGASIAGKSLAQGSGSVHDSLSTLPRVRTEYPQQLSEPNPALLTMRNMA